MSRCGVVCSKKDTWEPTESDENFVDSINSVIDLLEEAQGESDSGDIIGHGDESSGKWLPIAIQWTSDDDGDLTPDNFLQKIGAHSQLRKNVQVWKLNDAKEYESDEDESDDDNDGDEDYEDSKSFLEKSMKTFFSDRKSFIFFCCGDGKLNPVPLFAVAKICDGLVAGFIGGVIYT
eukprot:3786051-Ditylum_brightwellii.AAC.1